MEPTATEQTTEETIVAPTIAPEEDLESKVAQLEAEKTQILEEKENYKKAYLKETQRAPVDESEDERYRRIAREELANSRIADIAKEQEAIAEKALKENKELKLAALSKTEPAAAIGSHSESTPVQDTSITPEQLRYFKEDLKWTDTDIARYKTNLRKKV